MNAGEIRQEKVSRFIIGIDLGTTNSSLSCVDTTEQNPQVKTLSIPQVIAPGEVASLQTLPSYLYLADKSTMKDDSFSLPWTEGSNDYAVGIYARNTASSTPGKVVSSAKSWLCNEAIDRTAPNLPISGNPDERKYSSVETMEAYLRHLASAWNHEFAKDDPSCAISEQTVVLTVPASFDAVSRELTVKAANNAELTVTLLEEPQAAFYSWLNQHQESFREKVKPGETILVCDIGGGTTDFSLIGVEDNGGELELRRIAVGDHILLGGDNMDITIAYKIQQKLATRLNAKQMAGLIHSCRKAKERLSENSELREEKITVLGTGSSLIGGTLATALTKDEVSEYLLDGFIPRCEKNSLPQKRTRSGLRSFGLDYETDTALTRHLAKFLSEHSPKDEDGNRLDPVSVFFNGGVTKAGIFRERIVEVLSSWGGQPANILTGTDPDLAVSRGAAWYGYVKRGNSIRIKSGSAFSYYLGVESSMPAVPGFEPPMDALCAIPVGMENGTEAEIPVDFLGLIVGESTEFRFFSSNLHPDDVSGTVIPDFEIEDLKELPPLTAFLPDDSGAAGSVIPISLRVLFTEIGTIQVWCHEKAGDRKWKLEFNLEKSTHTENHEGGQTPDTLPAPKA